MSVRKRATTVRTCVPKRPENERELEVFHRPAVSQEDKAGKAQFDVNEGGSKGKYKHSIQGNSPCGRQGDA